MTDVTAVVSGFRRTRSGPAEAGHYECYFEQNQRKTRAAPWSTVIGTAAPSRSTTIGNRASERSRPA